MLGKRRFWRIPSVDGGILCEDFAYQMNGIGGGNFLILGDNIKVYCLQLSLGKKNEQIRKYNFTLSRRNS